MTTKTGEREREGKKPLANEMKEKKSCHIIKVSMSMLIFCLWFAHVDVVSERDVNAVINELVKHLNILYSLPVSLHLILIS